MTAEIPTKKVKIYDHCFVVSMFLCCEHAALAQRIEETMKMFPRSESERGRDEQEEFCVKSSQSSHIHAIFSLFSLPVMLRRFSVIDA